MNRGHVPMRMCVICRRRAPRRELARYVLLPPGAEKSEGATLMPDERQVCSGRGLYVCADENCRTKFLRFCAGGRKRKGEKSA